ncbi:MAG: hypothetical protein LBH26_02790 [Treponema sp.]|jgi:hypothetical protein|nr:hypothetical protein [Treponema sp.]
METSPYDQVFRRQTRREGTTLSACCACCGKTEQLRLLLPWAGEWMVNSLRLRFNRCPACGRWVCDACFRPGQGPEGAGLCKLCAGKEQGTRGTNEIGKTPPFSSEFPEEKGPAFS